MYGKVHISVVGNDDHYINVLHERIRERPFDFQGGGGGVEKNILALIFVKKIF